MTGSAFTLAPDTSQTDLTTTAKTATATTVTPTNTGGTDTIIDTITIETMIGTTTGIDASRCPFRPKFPHSHPIGILAKAEKKVVGMAL
jgi:hypothetical protein